MITLFEHILLLLDTTDRFITTSSIISMPRDILVLFNVRMLELIQLRSVFVPKIKFSFSMRKKYCESCQPVLRYWMYLSYFHGNITFPQTFNRRGEKSHLRNICCCVKVLHVRGFHALYHTWQVNKLKSRENVHYCHCQDSL